MAAPPLETGAPQETCAEPGKAMALTPVGAPGTVGLTAAATAGREAMIRMAMTSEGATRMKPRGKRRRGRLACD